MRTKPHTIRFDEDQLPIALKKSGLTVQQLIDKLISDYVKNVKEVKELKPEVIGKPYNPEGNPRYKIVNGKKVFN